jgi:flagellar motor switch protein FliM
VARNVSEPEIDALLARREEPRKPVVARDFREPRRLSASDLDALQRPAEAAANAVLEVVRQAVPTDIGLDPVEVGETSLDLAIAEDAIDFLAVVGDGPTGASMVMLDAQAAVAIAEIAFGADESEVPDARPLTTMERTLIDRMLVRVLERAAQALQATVKDARAVPNRAAWAREIGTDGDRRRVVLRVPLTIGPTRAICHILLAGVKVPPPKNTPPVKDVRKTNLPSEIAPTNVEVCAVLARTDILLTELLALEPGDVITLDARFGQPISLEIEGQPRARARFGTRDGRLAARIQEILKSNTPR